MPSARYALAIFVNVGLPTLAYLTALPRYGPVAALIASSIPVLAWLAVDLARFRHFDARAALVLAGIAVSLLVLAWAPSACLRAVHEPLVSGFIGVLFLLSLASTRPMLFYLARSTLARERAGRELEFDMWWQTRPALVKSIRLMTAVWGAGLVTENGLRLWFTGCANTQGANRLATLVGYAIYASLLAWSVVYRHLYIRRRV